MKPERLRWERVGSRYDLRLVNPKTVTGDVKENLERLFETISETESWGRYFCGVACAEFRRWLAHMDTPLQEQAYARLSNWFLCDLKWVPETPLGVACGKFWDALFCARPEDRLTAPEDDHRILSNEFALWWPRQQACQGGE